MWLLLNIQRTFVVQDTNSVKMSYLCRMEMRNAYHYWKNSMVFIGTEGKENFCVHPCILMNVISPDCKSMLADDLSSIIKICKV